MRIIEGIGCEARPFADCAKLSLKFDRASRTLGAEMDGAELVVMYKEDYDELTGRPHLPLDSPKDRVQRLLRDLNAAMLDLCGVSTPITPDPAQPALFEEGAA